jgi:hypothetical protein
MKLDFAFLADAATVQDNGMFAVIGGGFDILRGTQFPATKHAMALVGRVRFGPDEWGKNYKIHAEIVAPDGQIIPPDLWISFDPSPHPRDLTRSNTTTFCFNYQGVQFPSPGDYVLRLSDGSQTIGQVVLEVVPEGGGA